MPTIEAAQHGQLCSDPFLRGTRVFGPAKIVPLHLRDGGNASWRLGPRTSWPISVSVLQGPWNQPKMKLINATMFIESRGRLWKYYVPFKKHLFSMTIPYSNYITSSSRNHFPKTISQWTLQVIMNPWPRSWFAQPRSLRLRELLKLPPCSRRPSRSSPVMPNCGVLSCATGRN